MEPVELAAEEGLDSTQEVARYVTIVMAPVTGEGVVVVLEHDSWLALYAW